MKRKKSVVLCFAVAILLSIGLFGTAASAASGGDEIITLGKIPVTVTINLDENNYFVKGLVDDAEVSLKRAETTKEEIEDLLAEPDNEVVMFPAENTVDDTPLYMFTFITDGYTNEGASLINILDKDSWLYLQEILEGYYEEKEEASWQDYHVTKTAVFAVCDRVYVNSDGEVTGRMARDYYTVWNGDLVQVMVVFNPQDKEKAVKWTEDYLATWEDAEPAS